MLVGVVLPEVRRTDEEAINSPGDLTEGVRNWS